MKKLIIAAVLATTAMSAMAQLQYCTPQAMQQAQEKYNTYLRNTSSQRSMSNWMAGSSGSADVMANTQRQWQANDQQAWQQTIGYAKMMCEAELLQLKSQ